jgi:hypothetical protein
MGESVESPNFYKRKFRTCQTKIKLKTKTFAKEGGITIGGTITRILIFRANQGT